MFENLDQESNLLPSWVAMHHAHDQLGRTTLIQPQKTFPDLLSNTAHYQRLVEIRDRLAELSWRSYMKMKSSHATARRPSREDLC